MVGMTRRLGSKSVTAPRRRMTLLATVAAGLLLAGCTPGPVETAGGVAAIQDAQLQAAKQAEANYNYADAVNI